MSTVKEKAGTWFDPQVVALLESRYVELERMSQTLDAGFVPSGFSKDLRVERGLAPAAGFETSAEARSNPTS